MKRYEEYMNEIDVDYLYKALLGHGLFSEKLPPVFTSKEFYNFCVNTNPTFANKKRQYASYENIRNINIPRTLGIPVPMVYQKLCKYMAEHWADIQKHFHSKTINQLHKVSRIHVRKMYGKEYIFEMNYENWREDGSPENELIYGKEYVVNADISKCFPSIYTHSLSWALAGKEVAKRSKNDKTLWYNKIDYLVQLNKYEQVSYAIYFAIKYGFELPVNVKELIDANDCILLTIGFLYFKKRDDKKAIKELKAYAKQLSSDVNEFERMWIFAYEILPQSELKDEWKVLKKGKVSFIKDI